MSWRTQLDKEALDTRSGIVRRLPHDLAADVGLWLVDLDAYSESAALDRFWPMKYVKTKRMPLDPSARHLLASRHALRHLLAAELGHPAEDLVISRNELGKPHLAGGSVHFNLSRSGSLALIGLSRDMAIGVDLEIIQAVQEIDALARQSFTAAELEYWLSSDKKIRTETFLACWTRKEACVKVLGVGLALPLISVRAGFDFGVRSVAVELGETCREVKVSSLRPSVATVAAAAIAPLEAVTMARRYVCGQ